MELLVEVTDAGCLDHHTVDCFLISPQKHRESYSMACTAMWTLVSPAGDIIVNFTF